MARLGTAARPAVVRVQTDERANEVAEIGDEHGWHLIIGVEPDKPEDITDVMKLLTPEHFTVRRQTPAVGRNDRCPCGSGRKHKHCCLNTALTQSGATEKR
jgi:SWIM/SEC-C metal-binding protein